MRNARGLTACLILLLLTLSTTPTLYARVLDESDMMPRGECEAILTEMWESFEDELMEREREEEASMRRRSAECEARVKAAAADGAEAAAAEVARDLLPKIAGLEAERDALRTRVVVWTVGGILTGVVAGVIIGVLL